MNRRNFNRAAAAGLLSTGLPLAARAAAGDPDKIVIGAILAMSGAANEYGRVMNNGIQLAIDACATGCR